MNHLEKLIYRRTTSDDWKYLAKAFSIEEIAKQMGCTVNQVMVKVKS